MCSATDVMEGISHNIYTVVPNHAISTLMVLAYTLMHTRHAGTCQTLEVTQQLQSQHRIPAAHECTHKLTQGFDDPQHSTLTRGGSKIFLYSLFFGIAGLVTMY